MVLNQNAFITSVPSYLLHCDKRVLDLNGHSMLDFLVMGTDDGYFAPYQLVQLGGHPLLKPFPTALQEPIQSMDNDLTSYLAHWIQ